MVKEAALKEQLERDLEASKRLQQQFVSRKSSIITQQTLLTEEQTCCAHERSSKSSFSCTSEHTILLAASLHRAW